MRRSARPVREELDDFEDTSWKRKSYALAQHNALPVPMPHPVYPPPKPCPPPAVVIRPSRLRSRPPGAGYRHPASYHPVMRQNHYQAPPPPDRLPTLSEVNAGIPDLPLRKAPPPPRELPTIQASPLEHYGNPSSPPELTTFKAAPAKPVISPASSSQSNNIHALPPRLNDLNDFSARPTNIPVPVTRFNSNSASPIGPSHFPSPPDSADTLISPLKSAIFQDSSKPEQNTTHPTLTTFTPQPMPEPRTSPPTTTTYLPQQTHTSPPTPPPPVPKTPPSLPSKPPPRTVKPRGTKIDPVMLSPPSPPQKIPHNKKAQVSLRPREAPPAIPCSTSERSESIPEIRELSSTSSESLITQSEHISMCPESFDKPGIPSNPASHSPMANDDLTSTLVRHTLESGTEQDCSKICSSPNTSPEADLENPEPTGNSSELNSFLAESKSPREEIDPLHEDSVQISNYSGSPTAKSSSSTSPSEVTGSLHEDPDSTSSKSIVSESPTDKFNSTRSPSEVVSSLHEDSNCIQHNINVSESLAVASSPTSCLPEDKTNPQPIISPSQHLPLTPSSQSRSSSLASIGCPRTPTSIRAAPSWQPIFPTTPLTRRSTSTSNSESSLSPRSSNAATPRPTMAPEGCQNFLPTPPSSPTQTRVDSVTPSSSISSFPHGHGQSLTGEEEEEEEKQPQDAPAEDSPDPPGSSPPNTTLHNTDKSITPAVNNTSTMELGAAPAKPLPVTEPFQTYKTRFWVLTVFSFICFLQTIVWGTFGPIAESAQAAFPSWDDSTIAAFPNWGPIIVVVFIVPMVWLSQKLGLQVAMIVCELFLTLGTMLRCFTSHEAVFTVMCHVSSVLFAFAACFTLSLPAMLAATWFPPNERITATAVGTLMCQLGGAAMYLGALVVRYPSSNDVASLTDQEREDIRGDIMVLMYIHFGAAVLLLLAVAIYFPSRPPTPPSASSTEERIDYFKAIRMIFKKLQLGLVLLVFAFSFGVPVVWIAVLNLSLKDIGINQDKAMGVAVTAVVSSSATAFIAARITDKVYGYLKVTVIALLGISSVFFLWFLLLTTQVISPTLSQVYAAVAGGLGFEYATVPLLVELAVEIGFPIPESVTGATLTFVFNLVSLVFLGLFQIPTEGHLWVSCVLLACVSLSIIPLLFIKETHKRSDTDRKFR